MGFMSTVLPARRHLRCALLGHKWQVRGGSIGNPVAFTQYSECTRCQARRVVQRGNGYQPVDWEWLAWHSRKGCD